MSKKTNYLLIALAVFIISPLLALITVKVALSTNNSDWLFTLGVFLTVIGTTMLFISTNLILKKTYEYQIDKEMKIQDLFASLKDMILIIGSDYKFIDVFTADEKKLFLPREKFIGKTVKQIFGNLSGDFINLLDTVKQTGVKASLVYSTKTSKEPSWYQATVSPMPEDRFAWQVENITETYDAEQKIKQKNRELEQMNRIMLGREMKMIELKKKLAELENKNQK